MPVYVSDKSIPTTQEGFLVNSKDWTPEVGIALASAHGIDLSDAHREIINLLQDYCSAGNEPPSMRKLTGEIRTKISAEKAKSIYLMKLFGSSPAKMAARLAGLPKPKNCL